MFIFEDPPIHDLHRGIISRVFTPRRVAELEPKIRAYCAETLDPLVGTGGFDWVKDIGAHMPMRTIGMLLGIPEDDQAEIRAAFDDTFAEGEHGAAEIDMGDLLGLGNNLVEYIDWRIDHPSDDLMTELLRAEFEDEHGVRRTLTRDEVIRFVGLLASAGNETTTRLIGWIGKVLADHPEARKEIAEDRSLIPGAIEELLRFESPSPTQARYVTTDVEHHGETVPAGSAILLLTASANHDEREFEDPERFDPRPEVPPPPGLRLRHPLLHRRGAGPARRPARPRRGAEPVAGVGRRLGQRQAVAVLHRARVGDPPGLRPVRHERR